ncbi:NmrA family NAD(P)-binding protein [Mycobacterium sp. DL592]|uniref:NmrA family NAD(P)-binding protein n=1 Tax=Mycobacterium sp. DL592 TaxID=2675524 RepID=UPI001423B28A|nr:NmrA family NAD(P)-binding protein [Mycobacterium sp. DL592]
MTDAPILVTGAAGGTQGSTGLHVTRLLRERGEPVRAFVHHLDDRSERLRAWGAEVVQGDLLDLPTVTAAMDGVDRAYFAYPVQDGLLQAAATFAAAARSAGVEQVVNLSQWLQPDGAHPTPHQTRHWLVEQVFDWALIGAVHLDAAVFYENLRALVGPTLARGVIAVPWGPATTAIPMVGAEDVARVAAAVLTGPTLPNGTVLRLMAGSVTNGEIADAFAGALGRPVQYVETTDEQWASVASAAGLPDVAVEHLGHLWRYLRTRPTEYQALYHVSDTFEQFTGRRPRSLTDFLADHEGLFAEAVAR